MRIIRIKPADPEKKSPLPPVGTFWCHDRLGPLYLRIDDETGRRLRQFLPVKENYFFSLRIDTAEIVHTSADWRNQTIIHLSPEDLETKPT